MFVSLCDVLPLLLMNKVFLLLRFKVPSLWCPPTGLASNALTSKLAFSGSQVLGFLISLSLDMDSTILWMVNIFRQSLFFLIFINEKPIYVHLNEVYISCRICFGSGIACRCPCSR